MARREELLISRSRTLRSRRALAASSFICCNFEWPVESVLTGLLGTKEGAWDEAGSSEMNDGLCRGEVAKDWFDGDSALISVEASEGLRADEGYEGTLWLKRRLLFLFGAAKSIEPELADWA